MSLVIWCAINLLDLELHVKVDPAFPFWTGLHVLGKNDVIIPSLSFLT